jgi:hypothetical protein
MMKVLPSPSRLSTLSVPPWPAASWLKLIRVEIEFTPASYHREAYALLARINKLTLGSGSASGPDGTSGLHSGV